MKKWFLSVFITSFVLAVFIIGGVLGYVFWALQPISKQNLSMEITIPSGASARSVSDLLHNLGLVRNSDITRLYLTYTNVDKKIQAGKYLLSTNLSVSEIAEKLQSNPSGIKVTLLEGWRREQIAEELDKVFGQNEITFDKPKFIALTQNLEGKLFPDTYIFSPSVSVESIISTLVNNFEAKIKSLNIDPKNLDNIIILASLIEREAKTLNDMQLVSGVLVNRLNIGMPLQVDATLQYAKANRICNSIKDCENWWPMPRSEDKQLDSQYNTYVHSGLPPSPIANPGINAIDSAWNPKSSDYIYYLTDKNGVTYFSESYEGHLMNIQKHLR